MFDKKFKSKLEKLVELVNEIDETSYTIHSVRFHDWLIDGYANREEDIFGEYRFSNWLDYLIERYEFYKENLK